MEKLPTPTVCGNYNNSSSGWGDGLATVAKRLDAEDAAKWPTPMAEGDLHYRFGGNSQASKSLASAVLFPTPRANDANGPWLGQHAPGLNVGVNFPMPRTNTMRGGSGAWAQIQQNPDLTPEEKRGMTSTRGSLNPDWEEWLMCTPIGWTDLDTPNHRLLWLHPTHDPAARTCAESACLPYIPRLTTRRKYRNARVKGIGNMQYPPTAFIMAAWGFAFLSAQKEHTS